MYRKRGLPWTKHLDFMLLDLGMLLLAALIAYYGYAPMGRGWRIMGIYLDFILSSLIVDFLTLIIFNSMKNVLKRGYLIEFEKTLQNAAIVYAIESLYIFGIHRGGIYSRVFFFLSAGLYVILSYAARVWYKGYLKKHVIPKHGRSLLVITNSASLKELHKQFDRHLFDVFHFAGVIVKDNPFVDENEYSFPIIKEIECPKNFAKNRSVYNENIIDWIRRNWIDEVMIILPAEEAIQDLAEELMTMGITVHIGLSHFQNMLPVGRQELDRIADYDVITVFWNSAGALQTLVKRLVDILAGLVGCAITGVLIVILGPMIYAASPGPIFYSSMRVGQNGKVFKIYKFRSMYMDADKRKKELEEQNKMSGGLMFKIDFDPRVIGNKILPDGTKKTGIGDFIRRTSLDEFPQFLNILKNDMSLVGTRPPLPDEWENYDNHHRARMAIKPGLTGLWQVSGRSDITDFEEIVRLDTEYIAHWSLRMDFKILLKTVKVVLKREGSV